MHGTRIALDVMGGDDAPGALVLGALRACSDRATHPLEAQRILLVGDETRIQELLDRSGGNPGFGLRHASEVIGMDEPAAQALRNKQDSSVVSAVRAVREGQAGAVVSMGNTGACVGAATLGLGTLQGVRRPGIAITLALTDRPVTILDMGANIAPKPDHLRQYGVMGAVYVSRCLGREAPRVGLLNIGQEAGKGTSLLKEAHVLLSQDNESFIGNIEGGDIFREVADVVVTDGFTGNVVLKLLEEFSSFLLNRVLTQLRGHGAELSEEALETARRGLDYSEYGGALLLGVQGTVVIGHGSSDEIAVANALGHAARALDARINDHIVAGLSAVDPASRA